MNTREQVAAHLRKLANSIELEGEAAGVTFSIFEHDEINENDSKCLSTEEDCDEFTGG